jgi:hypothetical protein
MAVLGRPARTGSAQALVPAFTVSPPVAPRTGAQVTLGSNAEVAFCRSDHQAVLRHMSETGSRNGTAVREKEFHVRTHLFRFLRDYTVSELIRTSLLPKHGFRNESVDIVFRFIPFFSVGGDFVDSFRLPDGLIGIYVGDVVGKGLSAAMFAALVMNPARDSQVRNGYRAGSFPVERASGAATHQGPLLFDLVRSFQPRHAGTHLLQCRDATTPARLPKRVPPAWRGWVTLGNVTGFHLRTARRAACPRRLRSVRDRRSS